MPSQNQMKQTRFSSLRTTLLKLELPKPIVSLSMVTIHHERLPTGIGMK
ncbi:unnamed protein product [Musa acuminata var. zebrina]